jgi:hypothetical protein
MHINKYILKRQFAPQSYISASKSNLLALLNTKEGFNRDISHLAFSPQSDRMAENKESFSGLYPLDY